MRTTLTLDPDVAERLRQRMRSKKKSLKETVNETLRIGMGLRPTARREPFAVRTHASKFVPGIDPEKLNQTVDELEAEAAFAKRSR